MPTPVAEECLLPALCPDTGGLQTLRVDQVAKLLVCSDITVRARARELGGLKFGVDWIFSVDVLRQCLFELGLASARASAKKPSRTATAVSVGSNPGRRAAPPVLPALDPVPRPPSRRGAGKK